MTSLGLRTRGTVGVPGQESGRTFDEEVRLNAIRLARFDVLLTLPAFGLAVGLIFLAVRVGLLPLAPVFLPLLVAGIWTWKALRRWHGLRHADPAATIDNDAAQEARAKALREDLELHLAATTPVGSYVLVAALVVVSTIEFVSGGAARGVAVAGLIKPVARDGEWWRLLTATYLHGSLGHLAGNAVVLLVLGRMIEAYDRALRLPLVYLVAALAGGAASTAVTDKASIGASGAVLGLAGYLLVVAGRAFGVPGLFRKKMWALLGTTALIGAAAFIQVDNGAHLGGVLGGAVVGVLTLPERRIEMSPSGPGRAIVVGRAGRLTAVLNALGWFAWTALLAAALFAVLRLWLVR